MSLSDLTTIQLVGLAVVFAFQVILLIAAFRSWLAVRASMPTATFENNKGLMYGSIVIICAVSIIGPILWFTVLRSQVEELGSHDEVDKHTGDSDTNIDSLWTKP